MVRKTIAALFAAPILLTSCANPNIPSDPIAICEGPGGKAEYTTRGEGISSVATLSFYNATGTKLPNDTTIYYGMDTYRLRTGGYTVGVLHCSGLNPGPRG